MLILLPEDVRGIISINEAVQATETAFRDWGKNKALNAPRRRVHCPSGVRVTVHQGGAPSLGMTGYFEHTEIPVAYEDRQEQIHRAHPIYMLLDSETGERRCLIIGEVTLSEMPDLYATTGVRTAATSIVGTAALARPDAETVGVLGSGRQARQHLLGICKVRRIKKVKAYRRDLEQRRIFAEEMRQVLNVEVMPVASPEEAVKGMDIILAATNSATPVLDGRWLAPGQHLTSIVGSNIGYLSWAKVMSPTYTAKKRRELDDETLKRADVVVVSSRDQAVQDQQGDLFDPVQAGILNWDDIADLGEVLAGARPGRTSENQITLFKNNAGQGMADVAIGACIYARAKERGLGIEFPIGLPTYFGEAYPRSGMAAGRSN